MNGRVYNIEKHNLRFNLTRQRLFGIAKPINLRKIISIPTDYKSGLVKCRILYNTSISRVEFHPYHAKIINTLKCVYSNIDYSYKWVDRKDLDQLFSEKGDCDDILIIKNQKITDTYYANTAFYKHGKWYTPKHPLLKGSQRAKLLEKKKLIEKEILIEDLKDYSKVAVFNAMRPFGELILPIKSVKQP